MLTRRPAEGKRRKRRRKSSGVEDDGEVYSGSSESDESSDDGGTLNPKENQAHDRVRRRRTSGKSDDFRTGIVPYGHCLTLLIIGKKEREGRDENPLETMERLNLVGLRWRVTTETVRLESTSCLWCLTNWPRKKSKKRNSGKSDDFRTGIL